MKDEGDISSTKYSCLNLIDLAGSERINEYESKNITTGETGYINKSLFVLAHVINKLAENNQGKKIHIPYRDSKLTRLLSQALGGNSLTTIICTVSPAALNYYQTLSTLRFAMRAKSVKLKLVSNEYVDDKEKIEYYKNEIRRLKEELKNKTSQDISIRSEGYGNINNNFGGGGYIKEDLKEIMNSYQKMNSELNNYKELYLKEKQKSNLYKEKYESLIKNPEESDRINNINNNNQINDDNMYIDEIISQIQSNDESNQILQNSINSVKYSRWKDDTLKISQNYKNDLSSLKEAYKQKIMLLHESVFSNNNTNINNNDDNTNNININFLNNNTEIIKDKEEKSHHQKINLI